MYTKTTKKSHCKHRQTDQVVDSLFSIEYKDYLYRVSHDERHRLILEKV